MLPARLPSGGCRGIGRAQSRPYCNPWPQNLMQDLMVPVSRCSSTQTPVQRLAGLPRAAAH